MRSKELKKILESAVNGRKREGYADKQAQQMGHKDFVAAIHNMVGVVESSGKTTLDRNNRYSQREFSLRGIGEAVFGQHEFNRLFDPTNGNEPQMILESSGAIDPTAFLNINTFSLATAGLVKAEIFEAYENPAYIGRNLVDIRPTQKNGDKIIGTNVLGDEALERKPGQPHPSAGFGERWVTTPETVEKALKVEVMQEAVFFDLTEQVLDHANGVGDALAYNEDKLIADAFIGATNSYKYKDTAYNTYQTASPWINDHVNLLQDYTDINNALNLMRKMTDPENNREILVEPKDFLYMPANEMTVMNVVRSTEVRNTTNTNTLTISPSPIQNRNFNFYTSQIWHNRVVSGLSVSDSNAQGYWWIGDFKKFIQWRENWPLRVVRVNQNEYQMHDRGLIAAFFANKRGIPAIREPRYVIRNKSA